MRRRVFNSKTAKHSHSGLKCGVVAMCIGGVEVQDQLPRRLRKRSDELLDQHLMHGPGYLTIGAVLQPAERGTGGQRLVPFDGRLPGQIMAERVVVVEVFVTLA